MFLMLVCESLYGGEAFKNIHKRATSTPPTLNANIWDVYMLTFFFPSCIPWRSLWYICVLVTSSTAVTKSLKIARYQREELYWLTVR